MLGDRDGSGAASPHPRDRERDREQRSIRRVREPNDLEDRVCELEFALKRLNQQIQNQGNDVNAMGAFNKKVTEEFTLTKENMARAETEVKAKLKEMQSVLVLLQSNMSEAERIYVGTPVGSPERPTQQPRGMPEQPPGSEGDCDELRYTTLS